MCSNSLGIIEMNKRIDEIYQQVIDEACANPLYRFAELVAADAVAKEREACAKLCEDFEPESFYLGQLKNAAAAIRARSKHDQN